MLLVIDVGNTNMEFGVYRGEELVGSFRLMTDANRTSDELGLWLCQYFQRFGLELGQVEDVVIGSVAPQVMHTLSRAVQKYVGKTPLVLDEALDPGLPYVECDSDERLGPDRAAADIAAIAKYGAPLVVLDFGTATTLDAVSREGVYLGGCITAGVQVSIDGLFQKTALLPRVELVKPDTVLSTTAVGQIQAGAVLGHRVPHPPRQGGDRPAGHQGGGHGRPVPAGGGQHRADRRGGSPAGAGRPAHHL